jgi:hypothetical protein
MTGGLRFTTGGLRFTTGGLRFTTGGLRFTTGGLKFVTGAARLPTAVCGTTNRGGALIAAGRPPGTNFGVVNVLDCGLKRAGGAA